MTGEAVEVAAQRLHVDRRVRDGLRAIEQHRHAMLFGDLDELLDRHDGAQRIGNMRQREQARARADELLEFVEVDDALLVDRNDLQHRADLLAQQLPRHDVGVMFEGADQDLIAGLEAGAQEALRDQVHCFGRAANEDDLFRVARIDEATNRLACAFISVGRALAQRVNATMHVGMIVLVVTRDRLDDGLRPLTRRRVVQIHQRFAVHRLMQDGKVAPDGGDVERSRAPRGCHSCVHALASFASLNRSSICFSSAARTGARLMVERMDSANARISAARASDSDRPRERR